MRKHFLLLFLMAILPLAGWAADLDVTKFTAPNMTYKVLNDPVLSVTNTQGLTVDVDYSVETTKYYTGSTGTGETPVANLATAPVGTYYVKVVGMGDYVGQTIYVSFHVNGKEITASDIEAIADQTYNGHELKPEPVVKIGAYTLVKGTDYTVEWSNNINVNVSPATALVTVKGIGNYSGEPKKAFNIVGKAFNTTNITVAVSNNEKTYDGTATQTATVTVTDKLLGDLTEGTDYTVAYGGTHKDYGEYTITVTGKGNYTTDGIDATKKLVIGKATLLVAPKLTKVYDGKVTENKTGLTAATEFVYTGLVDATVPTVAATVQVDITSPKRDVATYVATVKASTASGISAGDNYTIITQPGTFEITKKPLYVYANPQTIEYGSSIVTNDMTVEDLSSVIEGWVSTAATATTPAYTGDLDNIKKAVIVYEDATDHKLKVKANDACTDEAALKVLGNYRVAYNYNVNNPTPTTEKKFGTLTTGKRNITIALNATKVKLTKEYDGQPAVITEDVTDKANLTIIGEPVEGDDLDLSGLTATVATNTGAVTVAPGYKVTLAGAAVSKNAANYTINYVTTYYTVTKKALTITITPQSIVSGSNPTTAFNKTLFSIKAGEMAEGEDASEIFELALKADALDAGVIKNAGDYIYLKAKTGKETAAANYSGWGEDGKLGALIVPAPTTIVFNVEDAEEIITDNVWATPAPAQTVTFSSRKLVSDSWNAMVLPFDIEVADLSQKFGYCIVNTLNATTSKEDAVRFNLYMGKIAAGTPFLIKFHSATIANLNQVTINNIKIVGTDINEQTADGGKVKFTGQYKRNASGDLGTNVVFPYNTTDAGKWVESDGTAQIPGFSAYVIYPQKSTTAGSRIYVEDFENGTTVIKQIGADGKAYNVDGWYTLNGVKLQGMPTEKGIYINNGKKIVVK